ncbi:cutinase precursor [Lineolata rhizophorae]|uniref:Cutinase n=1 Tax=Lineolata rhizophorae TaxID=578093 RepID=A0A6A6PE88_9PEZI|nr:cutinase precursor [Lineolata rhizophorae]
MANSCFVISLLLSVGLVHAAPSFSPRQLGSTRNDFVNGDGCTQMTILFARGTTEPGNVGTVAGPPFFDAVEGDIGAENLAVQGIDYPADVPGFLAGGDAEGSQLMAQLVGDVLAQCPDTMLVMSGYSQGGQLVHNAADMLSAEETDFVNSVVIFGDPDNGDPVGNIAADKVQIFCNAGDNICDGGALVLPPHLAYGADAGDAADFVVQQAGL